MKSALFTVFIVLPLLTYAQSANKYFNKGLNWLDINNAKRILQIENGNYVFVASAKNNITNMWKPYLIELDVQGDILYELDIAPDTLQGRLDDLCSVGQDYFAVGSIFVNEITPWKMCISAVNNSSYNFTNYTFGDECNSKFAQTCVLTESGNILVGGYINPICSPGKFPYLVKISPDSEVLFDTAYYYFNTPNKTNWIQDIAATPDGGAYLLATVNYSGDTGDIALIKIDSLGNWQWHQVYNPTPPTISWMSRDVAGHIITTSDGGVLMSYIADKPNIALRINYVHKLNAQHQTEWIIDAYCRGGGGPSLIQLADSSYFVAGSYYLDDGLYNKNAEILKLSPLGELLWRRQFGGNGDDYVYDAIIQNHDLSGKSGYVLCGRTESNLPPGRADAWLVRLNCMGLLTVPQAAFMAVPFPAMPQTIAFANQSQYAYPDSIDGGHYILNWGDGSPLFTCGQGYEPCSGSLPTHTYQAPGLYSVTLQAIVCNDTSTLTRAVCIDFAPNPQAAFSYEVLDQTVLFTNLSQNAYTEQGGYYTWNFGDGSLATSAENPTHEYAENGSYTVSLTLVVCQDTSVFTQEITVQTVGIPPNPITPLPPKGGNTILVYPNPAQNTLTFALNNALKSPSGDLGVTILTLTGQPILQTTLAAGELSKTISVAHLPVGLYIYVVSGSVVSGDTDYGDNGNTDNGGKGGATVLARGKVAVMR